MKTRLKQYEKPLKFIAGGVTSATVEFASFLFLNTIFYLYAASVASFLLGLITSFIFNRYLVFSSGAGEGRLVSQMASFAALGLVNSQLSALLTSVLSGALHNELVAKIITMALIAAWNYVIMGKLIFNRGNR